MEGKFDGLGKIVGGIIGGLGAFGLVMKLVPIFQNDNIALAVLCVGGVSTGLALARR